MKRIGLCFTFLLLLGCPALAQQARITLRFSTQQTQLLPGEPLWVQVTLTNDGPGSAKLIGSCGDVIGPADYGSNCKRAILVQKTGGKVMVGGWSPSCIPATPLPAGQSVVCDTNLGGEELKIFQSPGVYEVWAEYQGPGPREGAHMADESAPITNFWKGFAKSNAVEITVVSPSGVDRQAYDTYLKPYATDKKRLLNSYTGRESVMVKGHSEIRSENLLNAILKRFPTSTYAGYVLGLGQGFNIILDSRPEYVVKTLWQQNYVKANPMAAIHRKVMKDGKAHEIWQREPMPKYLEDQRLRIENYLAIHPDHARRDIMELAVAYQSLALGDKDTALHALKWVSKSGKTPKWKRQAIDLLTLLKVKK